MGEGGRREAPHPSSIISPLMMVKDEATDEEGRREAPPPFIYHGVGRISTNIAPFKARLAPMKSYDS